MRTKLFFILALCLFSLNAFAQTKPVSNGVLNSLAIELPKPAYPAAARAVRAAGAVNVQVTIDENGNVISASAVSGHPLLRAASEAAARQAKFPSPGDRVKVTGIIVYNFFPMLDWDSVGESLGDAETEIEGISQLETVASDLKYEFPDEAKSLQTVIANFKKDEENARSQTAALVQIIESLRSKISARAEDLWWFEIGLLKGKVSAGYFDDAVLRENLPKFRILYDSAPQRIDEDDLDALRQLCEMAGKNSYSRKDRRKIIDLIGDF